MGIPDGVELHLRASAAVLAGPEPFRILFKYYITASFCLVLVASVVFRRPRLPAQLLRKAGADRRRSTFRSELGVIIT